ncbi:hypothetical protein KR222_009071 [Zaprionus bogoriensis]|nr:hypothetical protein KR222_009071 [Zaprionus bogoriensis]
MKESEHRVAELSKDDSSRRRAALAEDALSSELKELKQKEFLDRKRRQQLRNDCQELRELAEHLRLASITKELGENLAEINRDRQLARKAQLLGFQRAEAERQQQLAENAEREAQLREAQQKFRKNLSQQIAETERRRQEQYVQRAAEREELIATQRRIEEEDRAEQLQREQSKQSKLKDIIEYIEQRKQHKKLENKQNKEDIQRVLQRQFEMEEQKARAEAARRAAQREHEKISLKIGNQVLEIENRKRQRDNLLLDLLQAEYKAKDDEHFRQQLEQEQVKRQRARAELERYRAEVAQRSMEQALLRQKHVVETCTDGAVDQEKAEQHKLERSKRREYGALLLSMIEENNRKRAEATAENVKFFSMKAKREAELQAQIEEERRNMLSSVPASVLQYLPKQVLSQSDREYFNINAKTSDATENRQ